MGAQPIVASSDWRVTVCVASGPSATPEQFSLIEAARARGVCRVIVVNDNWRWLPNADLLYFADRNWYLHHVAAIDASGFAGERWTANEDIATRFGLRYIQCLGEPGLSRDPTRIHSGSNGGYQAIGIARHRGARTIPLVGYDMQNTGGRAHHFGNHPRELGQADDPSRWAPRFNQLAADLSAEDVRVVNCSLATAIIAFPRADLVSILAALEPIESEVMRDRS